MWAFCKIFKDAKDKKLLDNERYVSYITCNYHVALYILVITINTTP